MKFQATLLQSGKTATGIRVPPEVVDALGAGKRPAVTVSFAGHTYRSTIAVMGGEFMLPVSAEIRAATGVVAGDAVAVDVELDTTPREVAVPADLEAALAADAAAAGAFAALNYSDKRRIVLNVEGTKNPETRQRRIDRAVETLRGGPA